MSAQHRQRQVFGPSQAALTAFTCVITLACGAEEPNRVVDDPIAEGLLPADWSGADVGVPTPSFVERGAIQISTDKTVRPRRAVPTPGTFVYLSESELEMADLGRLRKFDVTLPDGIERVAAARAARLASAAAKDGKPVDPTSMVEAKLITGGTDTRVAMGIAQGVAVDGWMAAVGVMDGGGTATLIGADVAITAAHALFSHSGQYMQQLFYPREDWSDLKSDQSAVPYGPWDITHIVVPQAYSRNRCWAEEHPDNCDQYDIAFLRLKRTPEDAAHRWWFTASAETRDQLLSRELKNRGYPDCAATDAPVGCRDSTLYGDALNCELGLDRYAPTDGWSTNIFHSCDTSEGHSGSPMFYYQNSGPPVLVGVHTAGFPDFDSPTRNAFKRLTPNTMSWINGLL